MNENPLKRYKVNSLGATPNLGTVSFSGEAEAIFNQTAANVLHLWPSHNNCQCDFYPSIED